MAPVKSKQTIAYIAPEIPALSATFVYQEILELKKYSFDIKSVSIHRPNNQVISNIASQFKLETFYLYDQSTLGILINNILLLISKPSTYLSVLKLAIKDALGVGISSHTGKGLLFRFIISAGFVKYLRQHNVIHLHANFAHIPTDIAMYSAALHGVSYSFMSHANDLFERGWLLKEKVDRAKFAVTISNYNKDFFIKNGADGSKIDVIHCGINADKFITRDDKQISSPIIIGTLGRMVEKKGFDILVKACSILKKKGVDFNLYIAGDGPLYSNIKESVEKLGLSNNIEILGAISHQDVPSWLKELDIFILPCIKDKKGDMDGIPVVLMEAMISGVPVISTKISGIPELIVDGETGLLCTPGNPEQLAIKITELARNNHLRKKIHDNAIEKVMEEFNLTNNAKKLFTLFASNII